MQKMQYFLSYSSKDRQIALKLANQLKGQGVSIWIDQEYINAGTSWNHELEKALEACDCLLLLLSSSSVNSIHVRNELVYAVEENKKIIPIKTDNCKSPLLVRSLQHIDLSVNYEQGYKALLKALKIEEKTEVKKEASAIGTSFDAALAHYRNKNYSKALELFQLAADAGNADAMRNIGALYNNGEGVTKDYRKAMEWYIKAADAGNAEAMYNIGILYWKGLGVVIDSRKAIEWYEKAADAGSAEAMYKIGNSYHYGLNWVTKDYQKAMEWYKKAADAGHANAMFTIGNTYYGGEGVTRDRQKAMEWYVKAADAGNADAMFTIGNRYRNGDGVTTNYQKAMEWFKKAADAGNADAMYKIGVMYKLGEGITKDLQKAKEWHKKADETDNSNNKSKN